MRIVSISENQKIEKRIAITPDIAKKYIALGLDVSLSENYGEHLGFKDNEYKESGVKISKKSFLLLMYFKVASVGINFFSLRFLRNTV